MNKLTLNNIAKVLVEKNGLEPKEAMTFTAAMFDLIHDRLNEEGIVKVKGLGTFKMIRVEARESINVRTGERVLIDSHAKITFTPDAVMKELVNKPFSQFETVVLNDDVEFTDMKSEETTDETNNSEQSESFDQSDSALRSGRIMLNQRICHIAFICHVCGNRRHKDSVLYRCLSNLNWFK